MQRLRIQGPGPSASAVAGIALVGAGLALETLLMARGAPAGFGTICGAHAFAAVHCPGCYAALAAAGAGLALIANALSPATLAPASARRRRG